MRLALLILALLASMPARACDLALVLLQDTSSSLDEAEFVQMKDGLAGALTDPRLAESFAASDVRVMVVAYADHAEVAAGWFQATPDALKGAAARILNMPRVGGLTATGEAIAFAAAQLEEMQCASRVIDVATDGQSNAGRSPIVVTAELDPGEVQINGLVIGDALMVEHFQRTTQFGFSAFTVHAAGYDDFGRAFLRKLTTEISMNTGGRHGQI